MVSGVVNGCALRQPSAPAAASLRRLSDDAVSPIDRLEAPDDFAPGDVPPLLPVALRMADNIAELLSGDDGDVLIAGVHGLSARNRGIVELPGRLDRAVRVAVRDTGATHRQVKAKGRSLLEALKSISRGLVPVDDDDHSGKVKAWLKEGKTAGEFSSEDSEVSGADFLGEGTEWGARLSVRKQKRLFEALENEESMARGKGKKKPPVRSEAATNYGPLEAAAYAVTRLPMTFGAQVRAMQELRVRAPGFVPVSLLDFGAGPTPALWAAREVFGNNISLGSTGGTTSVTLVDASPSMMAFTRRLARGVYDDTEVHELASGMGFLARPSGRPLPDPNPWGITGPVQTVASLRSLNPRATFDMVVSGYSLGEIATGTRHEQQQRILRGDGSEASEKSGVTKRLDDTIMSLWSRVAPGGVLVLVEPGTPRGSKLIRRARALILDAEKNKTRNRREDGKDADDSFDAHIVAPCQHDKVCPMDGLEGSTWCHFSQRVKRTEMHRQMLPRGRGPQHQDERFSYVVIRRMSRKRAIAEAKNRVAEIAAGEQKVGFKIDKEDDEDDDHDESEEDEEDEEHEEDEGGDGEEEDDDEKEGKDVGETKAGAVAVASSFSWGRLVRPPIKRSRHVILDMCSVNGELDRHIVARSSAWEGGVGKQGYKAARKSKWGDLWPYRDPRKLHETKDASAVELEKFFEDFEDFDMEDLQVMMKGRSTPEGVRLRTKSFQAKRPAFVEEFVRLEREVGVDAMEENESANAGKEGVRED